MQAIILAAGMGKRLKELTQDRTKCMVQVNGVALIDRMLHQIERRHLSRIVIVVGYEGEKLMEYIDNPGAIRLIFNTEKPIPVEAFDTLSDTDPSIKLDVNTGPKTALELMADLEKK